MKALLWGLRKLGAVGWRRGWEVVRGRRGERWVREKGTTQGKSGLHDGEDDVSLIADGLERYWGNHDHCFKIINGL